MFVPLLQQTFNFYEMEKLGGVFDKDEMPALNPKNWFDESFQNGEEKYLGQKFGFRNFFIRLYNQIQYSVFSTAKKGTIVIGKDNYLFGQGYVETIYGKDFIGEAAVEDKMNKIRKLQDTLKTKNIDLIVLFAPGKAGVFPEKIPSRFIPDEQQKSNYECYLENAKKKKINHIDFHNYIIQVKDTSRYSMYPKTGVHWSIYSTFFAMDSLTRYIEKLRNIDMPDNTWDSLVVSPCPLKEDNDYVAGINLLFEPCEEQYAYPVLKKKDKGTRPKAIIVSDSFYWPIFGNGLHNNMFDKGKFWFYYEEVYPDNWEKPTNAKNLNLLEEIEKQDLIILMATQPKLKDFAYGFVDDAYAMYFHDEHWEKVIKKKEIQKIMDNIRSNPKYMEMMKEKAEKWNMHIDSVVLKDATWLFENPKK